jgi:hypothetical protein
MSFGRRFDELEEKLIAVEKSKYFLSSYHHPPTVWDQIHLTFLTFHDGSLNEIVEIEL